jgi:hypothetical protein
LVWGHRWFGGNHSNSWHDVFFCSPGAVDGGHNRVIVVICWWMADLGSHGGTCIIIRVLECSGVMVSGAICAAGTVSGAFFFNGQSR